MKHSQAFLSPGIFVKGASSGKPVRAVAKGNFSSSVVRLWWFRDEFSETFANSTLQIHTSFLSYDLPGLQFQSECWCGFSTSDYRRHGQSSGCTSGRGGTVAMDIYVTSKRPVVNQFNSFRSKVFFVQPNVPNPLNPWFFLLGKLSFCSLLFLLNFSMSKTFRFFRRGLCAKQRRMLARQLGQILRIPPLNKEVVIRWVRRCVQSPWIDFHGDAIPSDFRKNSTVPQNSTRHKKLNFTTFSPHIVLVRLWLGFCYFHFLHSCEVQRHK